jgi:hypothetical protein
VIREYATSIAAIGHQWFVMAVRVAASSGPTAVARMPPISLVSVSWVNRVREPKSSAIVTLSSANSPSTPMFSPRTIATTRTGVLPPVIMITIGTANRAVSAVSARYTGRRPKRSPSSPTTGMVANPIREPYAIALVATERSTSSVVAM